MSILRRNSPEQNALLPSHRIPIQQYLLQSCCCPSQPFSPDCSLSLSSLNSILSASACQLASMIFSETPTVPHFRSLSPDSISTRTRDAVPFIPVSTLTL